MKGLFTSISISLLLAIVVTSCASGGPQGKHHSHKKSKRTPSGYFFHFQH